MRTCGIALRVDISAIAPENIRFHAIHNRQIQTQATRGEAVVPRVGDERAQHLLCRHAAATSGAAHGVVGDGRACGTRVGREVRS